MADPDVLEEADCVRLGDAEAVKEAVVVVHAEKHALTEKQPDDEAETVSSGDADAPVEKLAEGLFFELALEEPELETDCVSLPDTEDECETDTDDDCELEAVGEEESRAVPLAALLCDEVPQGVAEGGEDGELPVLRVPAPLALGVDDEDTQIDGSDVSDTEKSPDDDTERVIVTLADAEGIVDAVPPSLDVTLGDEERDGRAAL